MSKGNTTNHPPRQEVQRTTIQNRPGKQDAARALAAAAGITYQGAGSLSGLIDRVADLSADPTAGPALVRLLAAGPVGDRETAIGD